MKRLMGLIALMVGVAASLPVLAQGGWTTTVQSPSKWSGCYIGAHLGYGATHHDTSVNVAGTGSPLDGTLLSLPLSSQGGQVGLGGGCDIQLQQFVIGAFGDYSWLRQGMEITSPVLAGIGGGALNPIAKLDLDTSWTVGGRAGLLVGPSQSTLVYALLGYTKMDTSGLTLLGSIGGSFAVPTFEGWTYGGGISTALANNIRLTAEYRYTNFDRVDVPVLSTPGGSLSIGMQPDMHVARVGISYMFGGEALGIK